MHCVYRINKVQQFNKMLSATFKSLAILKPSCVLLRAKNVRFSSHFTYQPDEKAPVNGSTTKMNMFQAINNAMDLAMKDDDSAVIFGEDVGFGGVFRCSLNLQVRRIGMSVSLTF